MNQFHLKCWNHPTSKSINTWSINKIKWKLIIPSLQKKGDKDYTWRLTNWSRTFSDFDPYWVLLIITLCQTKANKLMAVKWTCLCFHFPNFNWYRFKYWNKLFKRERSITQELSLALTFKSTYQTRIFSSIRKQKVIHIS